MNGGTNRSVTIVRPRARSVVPNPRQDPAVGFGASSTDPIATAATPDDGIPRATDSQLAATTRLAAPVVPEHAVDLVGVQRASGRRLAKRVGPDEQQQDEDVDDGEDD